MTTQPLPAASLRIGHQVLDATGVRVVTSTRWQGAGGGVVSIAFAEESGRVSYQPSEVLEVVTGV